LADSARSARLIAAAPGLLIRHWVGEEAAIAYVPDLARTHLISAEAADVLQVCQSTPEGLDASAAYWPQSTVDGLLDAGLLRRLP
jgi:hypothetical protein